MQYFLIISMTLTTGMLWSAAEEKKELLGLLHMIDNASQQTVPSSIAVADMTECAMTAELEDRVHLTFNKKKNRHTAVLSEFKQQITTGNGADLLERESDIKT